jgi:predicted GNAT family acetyltransferase
MTTEPDPPTERLPPVADNIARHRFELEIDGSLATLTYRRADTNLVLIHTEVPDELGGRGIGGHLVRAGVEAAAASGLTIVPECEFARSWLGRHPEVAAQVAIDNG